MKVIIEGKRLLEWAADFAEDDFQNMSVVDLFKAVEGVSNLGHEGAWYGALASFLEGNDPITKEALEDLRKMLSEVAAELKGFFTFMFQLKKYPGFQLETDTHKVVFCNEESLELGGADWNIKDITVNAWVKDKSHSSGFRLLKKKKYQPFVIELVNALPGQNMSNFKQCFECKSNFFHWRKRNRVYCSRICKGRAAAKK